MAKEKEMYDAIMKVSEGDAPKVEKGMDALMSNILDKGMMPKDAAGIQDSDVEPIYAQAYQLYNMGKYKDARSVFGSLCMVDATQPKFMFGHAACSHMMGEYETAAGMYMHMAMSSPDDPIPYYHASDCYIKLKDSVSAVVCLNLTIQRAGSKPQYAIIKERSEMTVKNIKEKLEVEGFGVPVELEPDEQ